jgi:hypothetical protein
VSAALLALKMEGPDRKRQKCCQEVIRLAEILEEIELDEAEEEEPCWMWWEDEWWQWWGGAWWKKETKYHWYQAWRYQRYYEWVRQ